MIRNFDKRVVGCLSICFLMVSLRNATSADDKVNFEDHVKPIFRSQCFSCHNTSKKVAGLDLSNYTAMMQGGGSGEVIEVGNAADSYLFMVMNHDTEPVMPPRSDKLPEQSLSIVRRWIDQGAPENSSSKVVLPKKPKVNLSVDVSAGTRPEGVAFVPDVLTLEPVVHTAATTAVSAIATSPWAKLVAVAGQKQVVLYHSETLETLGVLPFPEGQARVLKFSRNGALLLAGGGQGSARGLAVVWEISSGKRVMEIGDELDEVLAADISADQTLVALGGPGKVVRVYRTDTEELAYEITKHTDWIYNLEFSPDGILLATADRSGGLHVWEALTGREYLTLNDHKKAITALSFRIDGNILASASEDGLVKLWEMEEGKALKSWTGHGGGVLSMEFCRDGRIVSSGRDKVAKIWDQNGKSLKAFSGLSDLVVQVSHCDEMDRVIAGDWTGEVRIWNAADGKSLGHLSPNPPLLASRFKLAEATLAARQPELKAAETAFHQAKAAKTTHEQQLAAAKSGKAKAEKRVTDSKAVLATKQKQLTDHQSQLKSLGVELSELQKVVPELKAATSRSLAAATMMRQDRDFAVLTAKLQEKLNGKVARKKQVEAAQKKAKAEIATLTESITKRRQTLRTAPATVVSSAAAVKALTGKQKAINDRLTATAAKMKTLQQQVKTAKADVHKWTLYRALRDNLKTESVAEEKRDALQLAALEAASERDEMQTVIQQLQERMSGMDKSIAAAQQTVKTMQKQIVDTTALKATAAVSLSKHQQAIPILRQAKEQAEAAAALLEEKSDQPDMKQAITSLEQAIVSKVAAIQTIQKTMTDFDRKVTASQQAIKLAKTKVIELTAVKNSIVQKVGQHRKQLEPLQVQVNAAQQQFAAAEQQLQKAKAVVEACRAQLRLVIS